MARANRKGRTADPPLPWEQRHVQLINAFRQEAAWKALKAGARIVYVELKACYNGSNNGRIMASERFLADRTGFSKNAVSRGLAELQDKGFLRARQKGSFNPDGNGSGTVWELTELGCYGEKPTKDYRQWTRPKNKTPGPKRTPGGSEMNPVQAARGSETNPPDPPSGSETNPVSGVCLGSKRTQSSNLPRGSAETPCADRLPRVFTGRVGSTGTMTSTSRVFSTAARRHRGAA